MFKLTNELALVHLPVPTHRAAVCRVPDGWTYVAGRTQSSGTLVMKSVLLGELDTQALADECLSMEGCTAVFLMPALPAGGTAYTDYRVEFKSTSDSSWVWVDPPLRGSLNGLCLGTFVHNGTRLPASAPGPRSPAPMPGPAPVSMPSPSGTGTTCSVSGRAARDSARKCAEGGEVVASGRTVLGFNPYGDGERPSANRGALVANLSGNLETLQDKAPR